MIEGENKPIRILLCKDDAVVEMLLSNDVKEELIKITKEEKNCMNWQEREERK